LPLSWISVLTGPTRNVDTIYAPGFPAFEPATGKAIERAPGDEPTCCWNFSQAFADTHPYLRSGLAGAD
jgi:hypothetical protein